MTLIERVRAVLAAGTPGPWRACAHLRADNTCDCGFLGEISSESADLLIAQMGPCQFPHRHEEGCGADMILVAGEPERKANGTIIALAVNLAPAFVELWAQVDDLFLWEPRRKGYAAALKRVHVALAALNEAATREVGASKPFGDGITDDTDAVRAATFLDAGWPIFGTPQKHVRSGHREVED